MLFSLFAFARNFVCLYTQLCLLMCATLFTFARNFFASARNFFCPCAQLCLPVHATLFACACNFVCICAQLCLPLHATLFTFACNFVCLAYHFVCLYKCTQLYLPLRMYTTLLALASAHNFFCLCTRGHIFCGYTAN